MLTTYKTTLIDKKNLSDNTFLFSFKLIYPSEINFTAGQYLILRVEGKPRLYSIASPNTVKDKIEFIIELFPGGLASTYLGNLKIGEEVIFQGPAGQFKLRENNKKKIFLVTGTGIAPAKSILESNQLNSLNHELFWGLKTYKDVYMFEVLKKFNLKICLSREKNLSVINQKDQQYFDLGHVDSCFFKENNLTKEELNNYEFYLCGGRNVIESLRESLISKNILQENIILEKF